MEEKKETDRRSSQAGAKTDITMTPSVTEEANAFSAGNNRACSNGRSEENEYSSGERTETRDGSTSKKGPLCYGGRQGEELLCLQGIWAHGLSLQKLGKRKSSKREEVRV